MSRPATHRRARRGNVRGNVALTASGLLVAVWLGMTAPSSSPAGGPSTSGTAFAQGSGPVGYLPGPPARP
jgi:hypothetical protein